MLKLLWLIPALPLFSSIILILTQGKLSKNRVAFFGVGSVGLSALITISCAISFSLAPEGSVYSQTLWQWIDVVGLQPAVTLYLDGLSLVMALVVTCIGFLIHLYASGYMYPDKDYSRFFACMNLFLASMLILVLADNLLLLYMGWEGVGLCSYLLIGFWYQDPANGQAARKAFIITRVGDTAMAIGLFLIFRELGTLNIQEAMNEASRQWPLGSIYASLAALLLLAGAVGKSAQLPLQSWLPDAMAGPTPVSALIHAATMVTAGVYLIARTHELFLLAPDIQMLVAIVGTLTLLLAGFSALTQTDIKRILAYSTISQIGYMFLALGVGAWSAGIFHLVTHAFFKALLFLSAGSVILALHHKQDIHEMGGLYKRLPFIFCGFLIGSACLAALPFTSGFFSKEPILAQAWHQAPLLWLGGLVGAFLTALYSFRLIFIVFFGPVRTEPQPLHMPDRIKMRMSVSLLTLTALALFGGLFSLPLERVLPESDPHAPAGIETLNILLPLFGIYLAYHLFHRDPDRLQQLKSRPGSEKIRLFWLDGWGFDGLYDRLLRFPFLRLAHSLRNDFADALSHSTEKVSSYFHGLLSETQTGQVRWYASIMVAGILVLMGIGVLN
ncbi:NADH-quinone oxidoreductase subunit L [Motiliproteus sp. MSK22-1]|uniref:NADH-quinone oxidoreductase subunit L n=1 Tax=Motiliproteus sp. MSK22-1 TaxID=1897630 RepID=UPI00097722B7|nr:NADH-quinone oxidoreductase subunit L [Motiliproteus sp. MSK22-1]OMH36132.1 NADH-quinone oxidoreductase subunit L [Motiliproteus sp. MSK22-1]